MGLALERLPDWPVAMTREMALAYTGIAEAQLREWERRGTITEIGDAGEDDVRAVSGHKTLAVTQIYNKASAEKARRIASVRREHINTLGGSAQ